MTSPEARKSRCARGRLLGRQGGGVAVRSRLSSPCWCSTSSAWTRVRRRCSAATPMCTSSCTTLATSSASLPLTRGSSQHNGKADHRAWPSGRRPCWSARIRLRADLRRARHRSGDRLRGRRRRCPRGHGGGGHEHGAEVFTRGVQANIGMGFGVLAFSVAMGALFAVVFAVTYGRVGNVSARLVVVCTVAGGMLLSLYVVPAPEVPGQPAGRQPRRDDPAAHAAVPADGGAVRRRCSSVRSGSVGSSVRAAGRVERDAGRGGAYIVGRRRDADPADDRRDARTAAR